MKKLYIKPVVELEQVETECSILELSNWKTKSPNDDIPTDIFNGNGDYKEGDGEDAGAKKGSFIWDDEF